MSELKEEINDSNLIKHVSEVLISEGFEEVEPYCFSRKLELVYVYPIIQGIKYWEDYARVPSNYKTGRMTLDGTSLSEMLAR